MNKDDLKEMKRANDLKEREVAAAERAAQAVAVSAVELTMLRRIAQHSMRIGR